MSDSVLRGTTSAPYHGYSIPPFSRLRRAAHVLAATGLGVLSALSLPACPVHASGAVDILSGHDWEHCSGMMSVPEGVAVIPIGRAIVPKHYAPEDTEDDGARELAKNPPVNNPPINLRGPRLAVSGDFRILITLDTAPEKAAWVYLYGTLPVIYDEWRQEGKTIGLKLRDGILEVLVWDGSSSDPVTSSMGFWLPARVTIGLTTGGGVLEFEADGQFIGTMEDPGVFSDGSVYFGADAEPGGGFTILEMTVEAVNDPSEVRLIDPEAFVSCDRSSLSLRARARKLPRPFAVGAAVAAIPLLTDGKYRKVLGREFSMLTPENDMKFQFIHPQPEVYAFAEADALVEFAQANGMRVHGHTLVWHEALPRWVHDESFTAADVRGIMERHIDTVVSRYRGRVAEWDVVNEPLRDEHIDRSAGLRESSLWYKAMGERYIDAAFAAAHAADPGARLYINEYGIEEPGEKFEALYALLRRLRKRGVPVHGVGFQVHEDAGEGQGHVDPEKLAVNLRRISELGLEVRVSEMDVNIHGEVSRKTKKEQAELYRAVLEKCVGQPRCTGFGVWGVTDRYSSLAPINEYHVFGNGLIFDEQYRPKPSLYEGLRSTLSGRQSSTRKK